MKKGELILNMKRLAPRWDGQPPDDKDGGGGGDGDAGPSKKKARKA